MSQSQTQKSLNFSGRKARRTMTVMIQRQGKGQPPVETPALPDEPVVEMQLLQAIRLCVGELRILRTTKPTSTTSTALTKKAKVTEGQDGGGHAPILILDGGPILEVEGVAGDQAWPITIHDEETVRVTRLRTFAWETSRYQSSFSMISRERSGRWDYTWRRKRRGTIARVLR